jgi:hypothetical protein
MVRSSASLDNKTWFLVLNKMCNNNPFIRELFELLKQSFLLKIAFRDDHKSKLST